MRVLCRTSQSSTFFRKKSAQQAKPTPGANVLNVPYTLFIPRAIPYLSAHADQITWLTPRATIQFKIVALG